MGTGLFRGIFRARQAYFAGFSPISTNVPIIGSKFGLVNKKSEKRAAARLQKNRPVPAAKNPAAARRAKPRGMQKQNRPKTKETGGAAASKMLPEKTAYAILSLINKTNPGTDSSDKEREPHEKERDYRAVGRPDCNH
jgi:hypothetical protein